MLKFLKEGFHTQNLAGKLVTPVLLVLSGTNVYGFFEAMSIGSHDRAMSHAIYSLTILIMLVAVFYSSIQFDRASKLFNEAKSLYGKGYEEKRMAMYEKLLEKKEKEIQ